MDRVSQFGALFDEWQRKGLDRRRFLRLIGLGASASAVSLILEACGSSSSSSGSSSTGSSALTTGTAGQTSANAGTAPAGTPQPIAQTIGSQAIKGRPAPTSAAFVDKTYTVALNVEPDSLDVADTFSNASLGVEKCLYEGLVGLDQKMRIVGQIAASWEPSADAKEFTFHLNKGVKFHDGTPCDANAVKAKFDRVLASDSTLKRHGYFSAAIDHCEVVDDLTVKVVASAPFAAMVATLAHPSGGIPSPAAVKKYGSDFGIHPVGTGPYQFVEWVRGDHITMQAFNDYWDPKRKAAVSKLVVRGINEPGALAIAVQGGDAQFAGPLNAPQAIQMKSASSVSLQQNPSISVYWVTLNNSKKPFDNHDVRLALNYGVDKQEVLKAADLGYGVLMDSPLGKLVYGYHSVGVYDYDPQKAKQLLAKAGYPSGFSTTLWTSAPSKDRAVAVQAQLAKIGVKVNVVQMESAALTAETAKPVNESKIEMLISNWSPSTGDADWGLRPLYTKDEWPPAGANTSFFTDPKVETDIKNGLQFADTTKRLQAYADAQTQIWQDAPNIFLYAPTYFGANRTNVGGVIVQPDGIVYMRSAYYKS